MNEIWKDIAGYEGLYQISSLGRVKSLGNKSNHKKPIILKQSLVMQYLCVGLTKNSKGKMYKVHRLVADAFIPNPKNKPQVNHINGNKIDNRVENLEWNTESENLKHAFKNGLKKQYIGSENSRSKQVKQIEIKTNVVINVFGSIREAERITGVPHSNITKCCNNDYKSAGGYIWRFSDE